MWQKRNRRRGRSFASRSQKAEIMEIVQTNDENLSFTFRTISKINGRERVHKKSTTWKDFCKWKMESRKVWKLFNQMLKTQDPHPALDLISMIGKCCTRNRRCRLNLQKRMCGSKCLISDQWLVERLYEIDDAEQFMRKWMCGRRKAKIVESYVENNISNI